ncbi:unnamed protein product, partial [Strongylus vulgaris]
GYAENYVKAEANLAQSSGKFVKFKNGSGETALNTVPMNDALLSNEQQNSVNYQRIQQTSYNRPSLSQQYSDNIYGYAYSDTPVRSGPPIVRGQTASPLSSTQVTHVTPVVPQTGSAPYQSVADLKTTRLRDPLKNNLYLDSVGTTGSPGSSNAMFYPYR